MVEAEGKTLDGEILLGEIQKEKEWNQTVILDNSGNVIVKNNTEISGDEIPYYLKAVENRDETIGPGFFLNGEHYDVHRYHPPLVYGRRGGPEDGEGIAYCRVKSHVNGEFVHLVITYLLPILSPRAIPQMLEFSKKYSISYIYIYIY